jgi:hypothetical protein
MKYPTISQMINKKLYLLLFVFLIGSKVAEAQVLISLILGDKLNSDKLEFGLDGGINWSNISNLEGSNGIRGFHLGFYFNFKLQDNLYLHTGVIVKSPMGARGLSPYPLNDDDLDSVLSTGSVSRKLRYFNVPILLKYKFYDEFFIEAGPQLGLLSKAFDEFTVEVFEKDDLVFKNDIRDQYKRFDAGITGGLGYHLMKGTGMNFGVRYYFGMMDILKDNAGAKQKNSSFYLYAGIPIGAGKESSKGN